MYCERDFFGFLAEAVELSARTARPIIIFIFIFSGLNALGFAFGLIGTTPGGIGGILAKPLAGQLFSLGLVALLFLGSYLLLERLLASCGRVSAGRPRIPEYVALTSLTLLGLILGFTLFVVPGIVLFVRWSAAPGFLLGERRGILESLAESWNATRGYSWPIFFAALVLSATVWILAVLLTLLGHAVGDEVVLGFLRGLGDSLQVVGGLAIAIGVYNLVSH